MRTQAREGRITGILVPGRGIGAHSRPELGRTRPWIGCDLLVRRAYRAMVKESETRRSARAELGQFRRAGELSLLPTGDNRTRDTTGAALLAQVKQDVGEVRLLGAVDHVGGRGTRRRHAHVERPVALEREAARGVVELHG